MVFVLTSYGSVKLDHLMERHNPLVNAFEKQLFYDETERLDLHKDEIHIAFNVESLNGSETKDDPRYVKMLARLFTVKDGISSEQVLDLHPCTDEDLAAFPPPSPEAKYILNRIQSSEVRSLYCLDRDKLGSALTLWGSWTFNEENYQRLDFILAPCNYIHQYMGYMEDTVS